PARRLRPSCKPQLELLEDRRLLNAGVLDPAFGNGAGYVTTSLSAGSDTANSVLAQPDGKILVGGGTSLGGPALVRYNPDGSLDRLFGTGGVAFAPVGSGTEAVAYPNAGTGNDGKIVLPGPGSGGHVPPA